MSDERSHDEWLSLFVPGRLCLFGEHSDWAGSFRSMRPDLTAGHCIAVGTDQGLRARARRCRDRLVARSCVGHPEPPVLEVPMEEHRLRALAAEGSFWSYIAGTALEMRCRFQVGGLEIECFEMDLPLRKGLSSSAAVCVLTARASSLLYGLELGTDQLMDLAYSGERWTPSRCGRLDQVCAYGQVPTSLVFDGDEVKRMPIRVGRPLHYLIVDLAGSKDTVVILTELSRMFPDAPGELASGVRHALGPLNQKIVHEAQRAIAAGDGAGLGELMIEAQRIFDRHVAPACPSQLTAPRLHALLEDSRLKPWIWGAKGVGSQGDGTAQILARSAEARDQARLVIESQLGLSTYPLTLRPAEEAA